MSKLSRNHSYAKLETASGKEYDTIDKMALGGPSLDPEYQKVSQCVFCAHLCVHTRHAMWTRKLSQFMHAHPRVRRRVVSSKISRHAENKTGYLMQIPWGTLVSLSKCVRTNSPGIVISTGPETDVQGSLGGPACPCQQHKICA